jgi:hypothetical protein
MIVGKESQRPAKGRIGLRCAFERRRRGWAKVGPGLFYSPNLPVEPIIKKHEVNC